MLRAPGDSTEGASSRARRLWLRGRPLLLAWIAFWIVFVVHGLLRPLDGLLTLPAGLAAVLTCLLALGCCLALALVLRRERLSAAPHLIWLSVLAALAVVVAGPRVYGLPLILVSGGPWSPVVNLLAAVLFAVCGLLLLVLLNPGAPATTPSVRWTARLETGLVAVLVGSLGLALGSAIWDLGKARYEARFAPLISAIERYRADEGEYPAGLGLLVPEYLDELPARARADFDGARSAPGRLEYQVLGRGSAEPYFTLGMRLYPGALVGGSQFYYESLADDWWVL